MNTAQLLVQCLENEGVEYVFGLPGEENLEVLEALRNSSIKFITTRHELYSSEWQLIPGRDAITDTSPT